jgi:hypothetical protein
MRSEVRRTCCKCHQVFPRKAMWNFGGTLWCEACFSRESARVLNGQSGVT